MNSIHRELDNVNAATAVQCDPLNVALAAAGIDPTRFNAVIAYESTDAAGNPTVEVKTVRERIPWPGPMAIRGFGHNGVRILADEPFTDDMSALDDRLADERMDSSGWHADALDDEYGGEFD
jgi:hypothetical protein